MDHATFERLAHSVMDRKKSDHTISIKYGDLTVMATPRDVKSAQNLLDAARQAGFDRLEEAVSVWLQESYNTIKSNTWMTTEVHAFLFLVTLWHLLTKGKTQ